MKRSSDADEGEAKRAKDELSPEEFFLSLNDFPETDQIIVEYAHHVQVVFWPTDENYPQVWYHGRVIKTKDELVDSNLVKHARNQLDYADIRCTKSLFGHKRMLVLLEQYNDTPLLEEITRESVNTEITDLLEGSSMIAVTFDERTRVELRADGPHMITRYGECDKREIVCDTLINFAWQMFRDPYTNWIDGEAECDITHYDDMAIRYTIDRKKTILETYAKKEVEIILNQNVTVKLSRFDQYLLFRRQRNYDFDQIIEKCIELLPTMPIEKTITFETLEGDLKNLVRQLESAYLSTGEYNITQNKFEVLGYLAHNAYKFSFHNPAITVYFENWEDRKNFENHSNENIKVVFKDLVYDGTIVPAPRKNECLRVYFTEFKRFYYFFVQELGHKLTIRIAGVPDRRRYLINAHIKKDNITIDSFFYGDHIKTDIPTIKSVNFHGNGPRGMLLVKYIAQRLGATDAYLEDDWKTGKDDKSMNSKLLKMALSDNMDADTLSEEYEWFEAHREKIENWKKFYGEKGTLDLAMAHGYYGGFGFEDVPTSLGMKRAKVDSIACAAYMSGE